jgi:chloramphenicol 3-O phosphotransferase
MIVFLNGTSSAGKSSIAKALQELYSTPLLHLGLDTFFFMMPLQYMARGEKAHEGFQFLTQEDEKGPLTHVRAGPYADTLYKTYIEVIQLMADKHHDLVVDEVLFTEGTLERYVEALKNHTVYFIGIHCDQQILQEREIARGDRTLGLARALSHQVHRPPHIYDLQLNTTHIPPSENAQHILNFIKNTPEPKGFDKMRKTLRAA